MFNSILTILLIFSSCLFAGERTKGSELISSLLSLENGLTSTTADNFNNIYLIHLNKLKTLIDDEDNDYSKHQVLFEYLHENIFFKYKELARLSKLFSLGTFNCLTATTLYYSLCMDLELNVLLFESPQHVFLVFHDGDAERIILEMTDPNDGFDFEEDLENYIQYLLDYKLITIEELDEKGSNKIFDEYILESQNVPDEKLKSFFYSNLVAEAMLNADIEKSFSIISKAVTECQDSIITEKYTLLAALYLLEISSDTKKLNLFFDEISQTSLSSQEFNDLLLSTGGITIESNISKTNFDQAQFNLKLLRNRLGSKPEYTNKIDDLEIHLSIKIIRNLLIKGNVRKAFTLASNSNESFGENIDIEEHYISSALLLFNELVLESKYDSLRILGTSVYEKIPHVKTAQDLYVNSILTYVFNTGLYNTDFKKAKKTIENLLKQFPNNTEVKKGMAKFYRNSAMYMVRKKRYKKAKEVLQEGLKYDPKNYELIKELDMVNDLL